MARKRQENQSSVNSQSASQAKKPKGFVFSSNVLLGALSVGLIGIAIFNFSLPNSSDDVPTVDPGWVNALIVCLAQCAALGREAQNHLNSLADKGAASKGKSPWKLPEQICNATRRRCDVVHDAFCAGLQCQIDPAGSVGKWLPLRTATKPVEASSEAINRSEMALTAHMSCAARCASQKYLTVQIGEHPTQTIIAEATARLTECGLVHLMGDYHDAAVTKSWVDAIGPLRAYSSDTQSELSKNNLRANRTEIFIPFADNLPDPLSEGVLTSILTKYIGEPFSLDYVSVLTARAGVADAQELHSDIPFFPRTSISVHTLLESITADMGPTLFCPCTHSVTGWEEARSSEFVGEKIRFATALRNGIRATGSSAPVKRCLGEPYTPSHLPAGLLTIYDGAVLHAGLANTARKDRVVFNVNFASPPGYEEARQYTRGDTQRINDEVQRWRLRSNSVQKFEALQRWFEDLPAV